MKKRLDLYLFENGFSESREKARIMIMSGLVFVNNEKSDKPGTMIKDSDKIEIRGNKLKFVSRGGLKLEKAINKFKIDLKDKICVDIGASTGGFTDCMLQNGAKKVYAVDVGYGQLAWKLRTDDRVVNLERTNIRYLDKNIIEDEINFISVDVSFISLKLVLPVIKELLKPNETAICLIKPQFEAGKDQVGKKGVIKDKSVHKQVIKDVISFARDKMKFFVCGLDYSPIKGPEGNIEYLMYIKNNDNEYNFNIDEIDKVVDESHQNLNKKM